MLKCVEDNEIMKQLKAFHVKCLSIKGETEFTLKSPFIT